MVPWNENQSVEFINIFLLKHRDLDPIREYSKKFSFLEFLVLASLLNPETISSLMELRTFQ